MDLLWNERKGLLPTRQARLERQCKPGTQSSGNTEYLEASQGRLNRECKSINKHRPARRLSFSVAIKMALNLFLNKVISLIMNNVEVVFNGSSSLPGN